MLFFCNSGSNKAPQFYVVRTLPALLLVSAQIDINYIKTLDNCVLECTVLTN
jgi:hypothetical protein